jgi:DNA-binding CsgD family transcriptional regulator
MNRAEESQLVLAQPPNDILNEGLRAGSLALNASNLWIPLERTGESMAVIDAALDDSNDTIRETASAFRVVQLALSGYPDEAIARGETVNRDMLGDFQTLILVSALTISLGDVGRIGELTSVVEEGYARADCSAEAAYLGIGLAENHVNALVLAGEVAEAVAAADAVYRRCGDAPGAIGAMGRAIAGTASLACGQLDRAKDRLSSAAAEFAECGAGRGIRYRFAVGEVVALAKLGDTSSAAAKLEAVRHGHPALELMEADRLLAMAWVSAARGLLSRATGQANAAARFARTRGQLSREVVSLQTAAHFGDGSAAVRLAELAPVVGGPRAATAAAFAVGLRDRDGRSLQGAAETYESTGDAYAAADAWAHAANAYRADGRRGSALTASGQAQRLARECGGASSAALRAAGQPLPLTPREREVLALVAEGLSNRQIAGAMGMSIRTVEGHIYRASVRAGVSSRFQLGALVRDLGEALD